MKTVLKGNGIFSTVSGLIFLSFNSFFSEEFNGFDPIVFIVTGIALLIYGLEILYIIREESRVVPMARVATAGDIGWVLGTVLLILIADSISLTISTFGMWVLVLAALAVLDFALFQLYYLRKE